MLQRGLKQGFETAFISGGSRGVKVQAWCSMAAMQQSSLPTEGENNAGANTSPENNSRTLWIGDLQYYVDEAFLHNVFACELCFRNAPRAPVSQPMLPKRKFF